MSWKYVVAGAVGAGVGGVTGYLIHDVISSPKVSIVLYPDWNTIGWHQNYGIMASSLADIIPGMGVDDLISYYDSGNQTWQSYIVGGPMGFDFEITKGMAVMFTLTNLSEPTTWWY